MQTDDYAVLGLKPGATAAEIKAAYRELARRWHPDLQTEPDIKRRFEIEFQKISAAYTRLRELPSGQADTASSDSEAKQVHVASQSKSSANFYELGLEQAHQRSYQEALNSFSQAIRLDPGFAEAYAQRAKVCQQLGYEHRAESDLKNAAKYRARSTWTKPVQPRPSTPHPDDEISIIGWHLVYDFVAHSHQATIQALAYNPAQEFLASADDQTIKFWDINNQRCAKALSVQGLQTFALSPDSQQVVTAAQNDRLQLWQIQAEQPQPVQLAQLSGSRRGIRQLEFSQDGQHVLSLGKDETVRVWHLEFQQLRHIFKDRSYTAMICCPDQQTLLLGDYIGQLHRYHLTSARHLNTGSVLISRQPISGIAITPNGKMAAIRSLAENNIELWDLEANQPLVTLKGHNRPVTGLSFCPLGQYLASSSTDRTVKIWQIRTGTVHQTSELFGSLDSPTNCFFSSNGQMLFSSWQQGSLRIWELRS
jgi:WD40 repeat protein